VDLETLFAICNYGVLPAWALLLLAPGSRVTQWVVHSVWIPMLLGSVYVALFLSGVDTPDGAGFGSLHAVMLFFDSPRATLAGWVHYLVFDLFVGAWEARDAARRGIGRGWLAPCLVLTLMLGPAGLLFYLTLRLVLEREPLLIETDR
jgi:hypothetical protein